MLTAFKEKINKTNFLNLLIAFIPASFIAGNTIINLNIILLILSVFITTVKKFSKLITSY